MKKIPLAILGLGNVGRAFAAYILLSHPSRRHRLEILGVADRSGGVFLEDREELAGILSRKRAGDSLQEILPAAACPVPEFVRRLPASGVSVLVEALPTNLRDGSPALDLLQLALEMRVHVVTVDKGPLVHGFNALHSAASKGGAQIRYGGTTGVTAPSQLAGRAVADIQGVLNGTTNYILTEMLERHVAFETALASAQEAGIAEPDPSADTHGWDSACKIAILARQWMGAEATLAEVARTGIGPETGILIEEARASGRAVRLVSRARRWGSKVCLSVAPEIVQPDSAFFHVRGTSKAAVFRTVDGSILCAEGVSGREALSRVILRDIEDLIA